MIYIILSMTTIFLFALMFLLSMLLKIGIFFLFWKRRGKLKIKWPLSRVSERNLSMTLKLLLNGHILSPVQRNTQTTKACFLSVYCTITIQISNYVQQVTTLLKTVTVQQHQQYHIQNLPFPYNILHIKFYKKFFKKWTSS